MCGAYTLRLDPSGINLTPRLQPFANKKWQPIYNARPGEWLPIVTQEKPQQLTFALWQFLPHWLGERQGKGVINARAETVASKPYYREAFFKHRCIIPADGFYEWLRTSKGSQPYLFQMKDNHPFGFAGVYDELLEQSGKVGFAIITTGPNDLVAKVHDRMPVILSEEGISKWLDPTSTIEDLPNLLGSYPFEQMVVKQISQLVNNPHVKGAEVLK
jgi:putative SOS response-associated peptidase YedK